MDDERAAEGVEHLQAAVRELVAAARSFLDVVEDVVEDRGRLAEAAAVVTEVLRDGLGRRSAPWTAAWGGTDAQPHPDAPGPDVPGAAAGSSAVGQPVEEPPSAPEGASGEEREGPPASRSRVRRIPVD